MNEDFATPINTTGMGDVSLTSGDIPQGDIQQGKKKMPKKKLRHLKDYVKDYNKIKKKQS